MSSNAAVLADAALAVADLDRLARSAAVIAAMDFAAVRGNAEAFSPAVEVATPFPGSRWVCRTMRELIGPDTEPARIQDPFSLRTFPQVHGALMDRLAFAEEVIVTMANSASENPIVSAAPGGGPPRRLPRGVPRAVTGLPGARRRPVGPAQPGQADDARRAGVHRDAPVPRRRHSRGVGRDDRGVQRRLGPGRAARAGHAGRHPGRHALARRRGGRFLRHARCAAGARGGLPVPGRPGRRAGRLAALPADAGGAPTLAEHRDGVPRRARRRRTGHARPRPDLRPAARRGAGRRAARARGAGAAPGGLAVRPA